MNWNPIGSPVSRSYPTGIQYSMPAILKSWQLGAYLIIILYSRRAEHSIPCIHDTHYLGHQVREIQSHLFAVCCQQRVLLVQQYVTDQKCPHLFCCWYSIGCDSSAEFDTHFGVGFLIYTVRRTIKLGFIPIYTKPNSDNNNFIPWDKCDGIVILTMVAPSVSSIKRTTSKDFSYTPSSVCWRNDPKIYPIVFFAIIR